MVKPHFRAGVVAVVRRADGQVMAFERADAPGAWQLPQGGIEPGETPEQAVWRELWEETGLGPRDVRLVEQPPHWTIYEWPRGHADVRAHRAGAPLVLLRAARRRRSSRSPTAASSRPGAGCEPPDLIDYVVAFRRGPYAQALGATDG